MLHDVMTALRAGDATAALAAAERWVAAEPANPEAFEWLARAHGAAGDTAAAAAAIDRGLALAPGHAGLITTRAFLHLQGGDLEASTADFRAAVAEDPNQLPAYVALAHLALGRGDRAEAERLVALARRIDDEHPRLLLAEAQLAELSGDGQRALALLSAAVQRAPRDPLAQAALGLAYLQRNHLAFAEQALRNALALSGAAPNLHGALVACLEAQGRLPEAFEAAIAWVEAAPASVAARWTHARLCAAAGRLEEASAGVEAVLAEAPEHGPALALELQLNHHLGGPEAAVARLQARLAERPGLTQGWRLLLGLGDPAQAEATIAAWRAAAPASGEALEAEATLREHQGELAAAETAAREALALEPRLMEARRILARAAARQPAEAAMAATQALLDGVVSPGQRHALLPWYGAALHRVGRVAEAAAAWQQFWAEGFLPRLPQPVPASAARPVADGGAGCLLWGPPGVRLEPIHTLLAAAAPERVLLDRFADTRRDDGFNRLRVAPDHAAAGTAARWRAPLEANGLDPAAMIDGLPHWDGWTHATLHGTRLVALLRDPRDLLLTWLAEGSASGYPFPGVEAATAWLSTVLGQYLEAEAADPARVSRLDADGLASDPAGFGEALAAACGLAAPPPAVVPAPVAVPVELPAGSWRAYAEVLAPAFAALAPIAVRLGYPAE